ncbi:MAG: hypothetical protein RR525_09975, partial [Cellulosilyticaceae bacterium]
TDENGKEIIRFEKSKALPTQSCYAVMNANHEKIGKIQRMNNNFAPYSMVNLPRIVISLNDDEMIVRKDIRELQEIYEVIGNDFSIVGNWKGPHFDIFKNEKVVASVEVQQEEIGKTYLADIIDQSNEEQIIGILFAVSWII